MKLLKVVPFVLLLVGAACGPGNKSEDAGGDAADAADAADAQVCPPTCPNADAPDANGTDSDGDGVDGVVVDSVFVDATFGNDASAGTREAPVATIARGLELAVTGEKHAVLVAAGTYTAGVVLVNGISIHGSYTSTTWARVPLVGRAPNTIISTASPAVVGEDITTTTRLTGLLVSSANATVAGASSIAVRLVDASAVVIEDSDLRAGTGDDGANGTSSLTAPTAGAVGVNGLQALCFGAGCDPNGGDPTTPAALTAAPCECGAGGRGAGSSILNGDFPGGVGTHIEGGVCTAATGTGGGYAATSPFGATAGANGSNGGPGAPGQGGAIASGFTESGYQAGSGSAGARGEPGGGGGGGAAGRRVICGNGAVLTGKSGAHGGSGGCGGDGGGGGGGGGSSVALYLWRSTPSLVRVALTANQAGVGGDGAFGVSGATGGAGGMPVGGFFFCPDNSDVAWAGGAGGMGGTGGTGGRGGGGAGGISGAIVLGPDSGLAASSTPTFAAPTATIASAGIGGNNGEDGAVCNVYRVGDAACLTAAP